MLRKIKLYGILGERFGKEWELDINSVREAAQAIAANSPEFRREFITSHERGIGYKVVVGDSYLNNEEEAAYPTGKQDIKIIPVVMGAKSKGLTTILIGALIIGITLSTGIPVSPEQALILEGAGSGTVIGGSFFAAGGTGLMAMKFGAALVLGGIASMLAPTPSGIDTADEPKNYGFNGPVNTTRQGLAVPVCYGKLIVGGAVVSSGIQAEDYNP